MANKYINKISIQNKHDLEINWLQKANFIPLQGELIVYDREVDIFDNILTRTVDGVVIPQLPDGRSEPFRFERFKIGDGIHSIIDLPFVTDQYYTKNEVDTAINNIPEPDLSKHALKSELPTKVSQLENDTKFITLSEIPKTDLSEYAKKVDIPDVSSFITDIPTEYVTESELEAKKYLTEHQSLTDYAKKVELPTKLSHLENDTEYITINDVPETDLSGYAKKSEIPDVSGFITDIPTEYITESELEAKGYATSSYVDTSISKIVIPDIPDLEPYALKTEVPTVYDFISAIPEEYVTENDLDAKGYLTEHQSLEDFATKQYVDTQIADIPAVDLSSYAKKSDIPDTSKFITSIPSEYVTDSELSAKGYLTSHQSLVDYAKKTDIPDVSSFITSVPDEYVTETELSTKGYITDISHLAPKTSIPTKTSQLTNDSGFISTIPSEYITESELTSKNYATQSYVTSSISTKADTDDVAKLQNDVLVTQEALDKLISYGTSDPNSSITTKFYFKYSTD